MTGQEPGRRVAVASDASGTANPLAAYQQLAESWRRSPPAENNSPNTDSAYQAQGMPLDVDAIRREHVESFILDLLTRFKPSTANRRYRSRHQLSRRGSTG